MRVSTFRACGGFSPRLWLGGEEELLVADLVTAGHVLCYLPDAVVHHQPSAARDPRRRRLLGVRNTLWFTWLRRPLPAAAGRTPELARCVPPLRRLTVSWRVSRIRWEPVGACTARAGRTASMTNETTPGGSVCCRSRSDRPVRALPGK
jgi:hypothetical protein